MTAVTPKAPARKPAERAPWTTSSMRLTISRTRASRRNGGAQRHRRRDRAHPEGSQGPGARTRDEADDLQSRLEHASDDALREFGHAAIVAQRTPEALTEMQTEIRARKRTLLV